MTLEQVKGLWICLTIAITMIVICPTVGWVVFDRKATKA